MSALPTREYRVYLYTWEFYIIDVEAEGLDDARAKAEAIYDATGLSEFLHRDGGVDEFRCEEDL